MQPSDITVWSEHGILGIIVFSMMSFIIFIYREHKAERKEWYETSRKDAQEGRETTNRLSDALTGVEKAVIASSRK